MMNKNYIVLLFSSSNGICGSLKKSAQMLFLNTDDTDFTEFF